MSTSGEKLILRLLSQSVETVYKTCSLDTVKGGNKVNDDTVSDIVDDERVNHFNDGSKKHLKKGRETHLNDGRKPHFRECLKMLDTLKSVKEVTTNISTSKINKNTTVGSKIQADNNTITKSIDERNDTKKVRPYLKYNIIKPKFSAAELDIILKAMKKHGDNVNHTDIAKTIGRDPRSIKRKIQNIRTGSGPKKGYTLMEDTMIIDAFCKKLKSGVHFRVTGSIPTSELYNLSLIMKKKQTAVLGRWTKLIQPWILQYFSGTLNLQIVPILVNYLADNYSEMDNIDWTSVVLKSEFAGHTETSLRGLFNNNWWEAKRHFKKEEVDLLLLKEYIDQKLKEGKFRNISETVKTRQMDVINYFQEFVDKNNINNIFE